MCGELLCKCLAWGLLVSALAFLGIRSWMNNKSYVFDAENVAQITNQALVISNSQSR